jgi:hypothetical protein
MSAVKLQTVVGSTRPNREGRAVGDPEQQLETLFDQVVRRAAAPGPPRS